MNEGCGCSQVAGALEYAITSDDLFFLQKPPGRTFVVYRIPFLSLRRNFKSLSFRLVVGGSCIVLLHTTVYPNSRCFVEP